MSDQEDYEEDVLGNDANDDAGDDDAAKRSTRRGKGQKGKKSRRRRSDSEEFPNPVFLHNVEIDLTPKQNKDITVPIDDDMLPGPLDWEKVENKRQRKYAESSRLRIDERPLKSIGTAREYWAGVLNLVGVQEWYDKPKVIKHLATSRAKAQQANTIPWRTCRKWTLRALKSGSEQKWADDADINCDPIDDNLLEAVRIIGDTDEGFGTFPRTLLELLHQVGARFVLVKPEQRIIPQCWKKWADRTQYQYAGCQPNMFVARPVVNYKPSPMKPLRLKYHGEEEEGTAPPDDDNEINLAVQGGAGGPGEVDKALVTPNERATSALQRLNEAEFAEDENGDIDEDDVFMDALKNALTNGPIEGRIKELIHECLQNAGIETTHKLYHTMQRIAKDVIKASNRAIRRLEAAIKEDRAAMAVAMTAYEERLQQQENMYTILKAQIENQGKRIGNIGAGEDSDSDDNASTEDEDEAPSNKKQKVVDTAIEEQNDNEVNAGDANQDTQNEGDDSTDHHTKDTAIAGDETHGPDVDDAMTDAPTIESTGNDTATVTSSTIDCHTDPS
ncbi:hypothetical protein F4861DRAFT_544441 [Xylaria intraflava]|nr:hypothetical protein F4861DRAFT_544441 [Xylaria intraflava]